MQVGELVVVEAEEVEEGYVEVADRVDDVDGLLADLIGGADHRAGLDPAAGEEDRHRLAVVVAAGALAAAADAVVGGAAELAGPDDQGVVEQAALPEVADERGDGLVDRADSLRMGFADIVV